MNSLQSFMALRELTVSCQQPKSRRHRVDEVTELSA